jgi:ArsR family transcriptional regulator
MCDDMTQQSYTNEQVTDLARRIRAICEPNRLLILEKIMEGVQCNCELGDLLQMAPNLISHHLAVLREVGLIDAERDPVDGRWVYYSVNAPAMEEIKQLCAAFFDTGRIQPRRLACGPHMTEEQRESFFRMAK